MKISINKNLRNGLAHGVVDRVIDIYAALHIAAGRYRQPYDESTTKHKSQKSMTFLELAERVLREEKRPLTANEIWTLSKEKGYDKRLNSVDKTPWLHLLHRFTLTQKTIQNHRLHRQTADRKNSI